MHWPTSEQQRAAFGVPHWRGSPQAGAGWVASQADAACPTSRRPPGTAQPSCPRPRPRSPSPTGSTSRAGPRLLLLLLPLLRLLLLLLLRLLQLLRLLRRVTRRRSQERARPV